MRQNTRSAPQAPTLCFTFPREKQNSLLSKKPIRFFATASQGGADTLLLRLYC